MSTIIYIIIILVILSIIFRCAWISANKPDLIRNKKAKEKIDELTNFLIANKYKARVIEKSWSTSVSHGFGCSKLMCVIEGLNNNKRYTLELPDSTIIVGDIVILDYYECHFSDRGDGWNEGHIKIIGKQ